VLSVLAAAFVLGIGSGLRVFTGPAALYLVRGGWVGIVLAVAAVIEYVVDALPQTPSRTTPIQLGVRVLSGAFVGWVVSAPLGSPAAGVVAGIVGALVGTYGGHAARLWAIARVGALPAALAGDVLAIAIAALVVGGAHIAG
jgi:uncharacterized membrane protein